MNLPPRIQAIDALRALIMFLMIFVNDVAGVSKVPQWLGHTDAEVDGMGFADLIFPAFLFIVGLSLPFAIKNRINKGDRIFDLVKYILLRSTALIIMGFFHVNLENYNGEMALFSKPIFTVLITVSFFLIWLDYPKKIAKTTKYMFITVGVLTMVLLATNYVGGTVDHPEGLKPHWWGILGLIGWAYFFSAFTYLLTRGKLLWQILAFLMYAAINVTTHMGLIDVYLWQIGDASSITLMLAGAVIANIYVNQIRKQGEVVLLALLTIIGICCISFGFFIRPFAGGISKIYATPAWVFICMGISILLFNLMIYFADMKEKQHWLALLKPAGTSTLTCYLIPYVVYSLLAMFNFNYPDVFNYGVLGIVRSIVFAFVVIRLVGVMEKFNLRLKI
jgi:predicted acyltransferase